VNPTERTRWVVEHARALGFDLCGIAPVEAFDELKHLPEWLARGYAGQMRYLHTPRRLDPARVLEGARSVIVCALNYNTPHPYSTEIPPGETGRQDNGGTHAWISRYAWGDDYHNALGRMLDDLVAAMRTQFREEAFAARSYVDTGPIVERVAAKYAGLGWLAKNTCLINESLGSWLFLGVILTTLDLAPSLASGEPPPPDLCGNCRLCIDACPTSAIVEPYVLDARRCISYLTIELRGTIPEELRPAMGRMVFGCDICQDVCPWNRKTAVTSLAASQPRQLGKDANRVAKNENREAVNSSDSLFAPPLEWLATLSEEDFARIFRGSAVKRTKWRGLIRNACVALGNSATAPQSAAYPKMVRVLERLADSTDAIIAEHARWALARLCRHTSVDTSSRPR
jgi:epoxyqueuosine reductase